MKKFHSPLQKVRKVLDQQLSYRTAQLLRSRHVISRIDDEIESIRTDMRNAGQLLNTHTHLHAGVLESTNSNNQALKTRLEHKQDQKQQELHRNRTLTEEVRQATAMCDGLDEILRRRYEAHRKRNMHAEQIAFDESFASRNHTGSGEDGD